MKKLTEEQKKLVSDNHDLIEKFMKIKKLTDDDYYYVLAEALCKAAMNYNKDLSSFRTYAAYVLNTSLKNENRKRCQPTTIPDSITVSTDKCFSVSDERITISDTLKYPNATDIEDAVLLKIGIKESLKLLTPKERLIVGLLNKGCSRKQI